jgi:hypothetical protein
MPGACCFIVGLAAVRRVSDRPAQLRQRKANSAGLSDLLFDPDNLRARQPVLISGAPPGAVIGVIEFVGQPLQQRGGLSQGISSRILNQAADILPVRLSRSPGLKMQRPVSLKKQKQAGAVLRRTTDKTKKRIFALKKARTL